MLTLDLIIATLGPDGIERVARMVLPPMEGVRYIVSWQEPGDTPVPAELDRPDMVVLRLEGRGLSRNRNNALDHSDGDIRLIADDDLEYTPEQLRAVIRTFEENPELDMAFFKYEGEDAKHYPAAECRMDRPEPGYFITAFEMAVRNRGRAGELRYDERFGLGAMLPLGEEDELLHRAMCEGLDVRFFPIVITRHRGLTTGLRPVTDPRALKATGAVIALNYPLTWPLRVPLKAVRLARRGGTPLLRALRYGMAGTLWRIFRY